jgi:hypothetical protein
MTDTSETISAVMRMRLLKLSGPERLLMGFAMFDAARAMMVASRPNMTTTEKRKTIFQRLYWHEFDDHTIKKILSFLEKKDSR